MGYIFDRKNGTVTLRAKTRGEKEWIGQMHRDLIRYTGDPFYNLYVEGAELGRESTAVSFSVFSREEELKYEKALDRQRRKSAAKK